MVESNMINSSGTVRVNVNEFRAKFKSKQEAYQFCVQEVRCYLPSYQTITSKSSFQSNSSQIVYHLKDIIAGRKKFVNASKMKYLYAPQYESLGISQVFNYIKTMEKGIIDYLPDERDCYRLPRQYMLNLVYTLSGETFANWVQSNIAERNNELAAKQDLMIEMDPQIAKAFAESTQISSKQKTLIQTNSNFVYL